MGTMRKPAIALLLLLTLTACGNTSMGRAMTGAGIGAVAGTTGALATNSNPIVGAFVGAATGALIGAISDSEIRL